MVAWGAILVVSLGGLLFLRGGRVVVWIWRERGSEGRETAGGKKWGEEEGETPESGCKV